MQQTYFKKQGVPLDKSARIKEIQEVPNSCAKFSEEEDSACLFLPTLAELIFCVLCVDPGDFISAKDEQNQRQRWSKGKMTDKCGFPHPDLMGEEGHRFWSVSSNLGSC